MPSATEMLGAMPLARRQWLLRGLIVAAALLLLGSFYLALMPQHAWEYPLVRQVNIWAHDNKDRVNDIINGLADTNQGVLLVAMVWWLWVRHGEAVKTQLLTGTVAAALAGLVSRAMQILLPTHPRPMHEMHGLYVPIGVDPDMLNRYNGYPSDHAAVMFGLVATILLVNRGLGCVAALWATLLVLVRIYELYHYPSDIIAGAALGVLMVCLALNSRWLTSVAACWRGFAARAPAAFTVTAFLFSFMVADLFSDVRRIGRVLAKGVLAHFGLI